MTIGSGSTRIWTTEDNKRQMQVSDDAFIAKDIGRFNHADDAKMHMPGGVEMDMAAHVADIVDTYAAFPDIGPHNHDYKIVFAEGEWTFAVADVTGTNTGPIIGPAGAYVPPTNKKVAFELCTVARWVQGEMVEEYIWTDVFRMLRQLGFAGPPVGTEVPPTLEMNAATPLRSGMGGSSEQNKHLMKESDDALNAGTFNAQDLHFAEGITVYGSSEAPTGADAYLRDTERVREAFPDLHLYNDPYRVVVAEGDWTGTVARMTGTQTGPITSPEGMDMPTIPPTNRAFDLNHYTIARWQNGEIVQLKILFDFVGVLQQLGLG
jgi:predicted ester cyclase